MIEHWLPVPGYEETHDVSDLGRIRRRKTGRILKGSPNQKGYIQVNFHVDGVQKLRLVHRVVMEAFVGPCPDGMEVDHEDTIPNHNALSNLRYLTPKQNIEHSIAMGNAKIGEEHPDAVLTWDAVRAIRADYAYRKKGRDGPSLAARYGVSKTAVMAVVNGQTWKLPPQEAAHV